MLTYNGGYPEFALFLPDKDNASVRIRFKFRFISDQGEYFSINSAGLIDSGVSLSIATPKKFAYEEGLRVIIEGTKYSVESIYLYIPDKAAGGVIKRKLNSEYIVNLV